MRVAVLAGAFVWGSGVSQQAEVAPLHVGGNVKAPNMIYSVVPDISAADMKLYRQCGQIYLWVEADGEPSHVKLMKSTESPGVDTAFVAGTKKYRFKPAMMDGKPVTVDLYIDVCF
jgi:protein TonB